MEPSKNRSSIGTGPGMLGSRIHLGRTDHYIGLLSNESNLSIIRICLTRIMYWGKPLEVIVIRPGVK